MLTLLRVSESRELPQRLADELLQQVDEMVARALAAYKHTQPRDPGSGWKISWNCVPYSPWSVISSAIRRW